MKEKSSAFNLGPKEKRKRLLLGIICFFLGAALSVYFVFEEMSPGFRLLVWPLFFMAMLGFLQAKERTCIIHALKRTQCLDREIEPVSDVSLGRTLRQKTQKIILQALLFSGALTLACLYS